METGIISPLGILGIILLVVGIIMTIIGIILLIANQNKPKYWFIWFSLIVGIILGIIGSIVIVIVLMQENKLDVRKIDNEFS